MMADKRKKCRQYSLDYLKFGFIASPSNQQLPMCLICEKVFSNDAMKPSKMDDHLSRVHADKKSKPLSFFQALKEKLDKRPSIRSMFASSSIKDDDGLRASYNISLLIAKSGKPHTIGEQLILPAIAEVLNNVLHKSAHDILKRIPLSNNTVQRRIDEMGRDVENTLCKFLQTNRFSLQLDESTLPGNEALLLGYVRFIKDENMCQELLFATYLETDTRGESIFEAVEHFLTDKAIPWKNIVSVATDGAPSMVGRHRGFIAHLKRQLPDVLVIHCVIHRQHLVAKMLSPRLHKSLQYVINAINKIRSNSLNSRLFAQLCEENDEVFTRLLLHTEVRWLSRGSCLERFSAIFESVLEFLQEKDPNLKENLNNCKTDIYYLTDIFGMFNKVNLQLQGDDLNLIKTKSIISAFVGKLILYKQNLGRKEYSQFSHLSKLPEMLQDDDILLYVTHLDALHKDFTERFEDVLNLQIPQWIINPYNTTAIEEANVIMQEELITISTDEELKQKFNQGYQKFWLQRNIETQYPTLWNIAEKYLIAFPSSYLVEKSFSVVTNILTKQRNRLKINERGDLRLQLTNIEPDVARLVDSHQVHPSH